MAFPLIGAGTGGLPPADPERLMLTELRNVEYDGEVRVAIWNPTPVTLGNHVHLPGKYFIAGALEPSAHGRANRHVESDVRHRRFVHFRLKPRRFSATTRSP